MAEPKKETKQKITNVDKDVEKLETSYIVGGIRKWCSSCAKLKKLNVELQYGPAELKTKTCAGMFIAALFTIANGGNIPNVHQWMNGETKCVIFTQWNTTQP